jgi:ribosome-associated protein
LQIKSLIFTALKQLNLTQLIIEGIQERKGRKIVHIDLSEIESSPAHDFFICEGTSQTHVGAVADSVRDYLLEQARVKPYNYDGYQNSQWIVLDYGSALVHVFAPHERERYNLEDLWSDGIITEIPDLD